MAPYDFDAPDAGTILRCSDGKELRVHRLLLSFSSSVFHGMFRLPQPTDSYSGSPTVDVSEPSDILQPLIQYLYLRSPSKIPDISAWTALYAIADKYDAEGVMGSLRDMLIPRFLKTSPLRVSALASRWGLEEEAKIASTRTLTLNIFKDFPREDAELMGGTACQRLYLLHLDRREAARALISNCPRPSSSHHFCICSEKFPNFIPALHRRVDERPSLTLEGVYEEVIQHNWPGKCSEGCRFSIENLHTYFSSLVREISKLPQLI